MGFNDKKITSVSENEKFDNHGYPLNKLENRSSKQFTELAHF